MVFLLVTTVYGMQKGQALSEHYHSWLGYGPKLDRLGFYCFVLLFLLGFFCEGDVFQLNTYLTLQLYQFY